MRTKKLFSKLFPSYFFISLVGLVFLLLITRFAFKNFYYEEMSTNLIQKAHIISEEVTNLVIKGDQQLLQKRVETISKNAENRISIILPSGKVIADSGHDPQEMELHNQRDEVNTALSGDIGRSLRESTSLGKKHLYLAIPLKQNGEVIAVLRNSITVDKLQTSLSQLTERVLLWSLLLVVLLIYFIYIQAKKISLPLEQMKDQVDRFAASNFDQTIVLKKSSTEEIASLFDAIISMSKRLQSQFSKINKQKNEQLAVFGSMLEGVITIYSDMNIYHINEAAMNIFHHKADKSLKGTPLRDLVKSDRICEMAQQLLTDKKTIINEFKYDTGLILNIHGTIFQSKETNMLGAVLVFNDITKVRELEDHRKHFVANVSHELKTPLTAIQGYLETILEEDIEDKEVLKKFLKIMSKHSSRLKSIIEDLLSLSSIERETGLGELEYVDTKLSSVVTSTISLCEDKAHKKGVKLVFKKNDYRAKVNIPLLEQALINLIDNAIKYGPVNSTVHLKVEKEEDKLLIIVEDEGLGIDQVHHDRLFERFYSVDKARSRELGGSGLGLSIVKHIALSHGGNVKVQSSPGNGSSFIIELPLLD